MADINVTPFVDVMLVLLVIFMVTAPLLTVGVPVDLPKANATAIAKPEAPLIVTVTAEGKVYLQETEMTDADLIDKLKALSANKAEQRIYVRGDKAVPYGRVMEVMAQLAGAGFNKVALIAESSEGSPDKGAPKTAPPARPGAPGR
ncbi:MAG: protein TolR [Rhodospirillaceae bacterium]|nr:protein TolR [Rhodospirillaceae bacterium]